MPAGLTGKTGLLSNAGLSLALLSNHLRRQLS